MGDECDKHLAGDRLVAVFPDAAVSVGVVGLGALTLDTGSVHRPGAAQLAAGVAPTAQAGLERDGETLNVRE